MKGVCLGVQEFSWPPLNLPLKGETSYSLPLREGLGVGFFPATSVTPLSNS